MVVSERSLQRDEANFLENNVAIWISQYFFFDPIPPLHVRIGELKGGNAGRHRHVLKLAVTLFLGEKAFAIGHDQSHIASARLIYARVINFVQDAVASGEPHPAVLIQGCAYATLRARSPTRRNSRPARSISFWIT